MRSESDTSSESQDSHAQDEDAEEMEEEVMEASGRREEVQELAVKPKVSIKAPEVKPKPKGLPQRQPKPVEHVAVRPASRYDITIYAVDDCHPHHMCGDGTCVSRYQVCDGVSDCSDGSDEIKCRCDQGMRRCALETSIIPYGRECITLNQFCDDKSDCHNGYDESRRACGCNAGEFQCGLSKRCIPYNLRCDNDDNCGDGSDEQNCGCDQGMRRCALETSIIPYGRECITLNQFCDDKSDCYNNYDESRRACGCNAGEFQCGLSKRCIPYNLRCDNDDNCGDGSDEQNCGYDLNAFYVVKQIVTLTTCAATDRASAGTRCATALVTAATAATRLRCDQGMRGCALETSIIPYGRECITLNQFCDDKSDCHNGYDESRRACGCNAGEFQCGLSKRCIPYNLRCDNDDNCGDGSDEQNCDCHPHHMCGDGTCVSRYQVCDGVSDCSDGSDEIKCRCDKGMRRCALETSIISYGRECITLNQFCDDKSDCYNNYDESRRACGCNAGEFQCGLSKLCILDNWRCDNDDDCEDKSDEQNCSKRSSFTLFL
ncbi:Low-density lipoprotein (LDL) receptor class A repeat [Trinorchestia longiramus]|nr:Low-density lipoprotein (LDL) receptor class A repeat [Trinorchestia longiramus]